MAKAEDTARILAARAASHAILDHAGTVFWLLRALAWPRVVDDAVPILLAREPASQISLDGPVGWLLRGYCTRPGRRTQPVP